MNKKKKKLYDELYSLQEKKTELSMIIETLLKEDASMNEIILISSFGDKIEREQPEGFMGMGLIPMINEDMMQMFENEKECSLEVSSTMMIEFVGLLIKSIDTKMKRIENDLR